jgi:hypothetical protein
MTAPVKLYHEEMHANIGFFGTWLPGDPLRLGDIGILESGRFRPQTTLAELGIKFAGTGKGSPQNLQYTSKSGTALSVRAGAEVQGPLPASAEIDISFSHEGAFLFHASNVTNQSLENRLALADSVSSLYSTGTWKKEWYLVESLYTADCATIIISEDSSAHLVIGAASSLPLGTLPLADPQVRLSVSSASGKMVQVVGGRDLRPLYSCIRLKETWLGEVKVVPVRGTSREPGEMPFARASIAELLNS